MTPVGHMLISVARDTKSGQMPGSLGLCGDCGVTRVEVQEVLNDTAKPYRLVFFGGRDGLPLASVSLNHRMAVKLRDALLPATQRPIARPYVVIGKVP